MKTLIYSNLFIALCAALLTMGSYRLIDARPDVFLVLHVFGVTLMAYNVQRLARLEKFSNRTDQIRWYLKNKWMLYTSLLIGILLAGITLFYLPWRILIYFSPLALVSTFYSIPIAQGRTIRAIPGLKVFLIALVWTGVTLLLPMVMAGVAWSQSEILLTLQRFLFILAITIPFDIRDLKFDEPEMRTIPQLLGYSKSKFLAKLLIVICIGLQVVLVLTDNLKDLSTKQYALILFYAAVGGLIERIRADSPDMYFTGVLDGTMLLLGLILIFF